MPDPPKDLSESEQDRLYQEYLQGDAVMHWLEGHFPDPITEEVMSISEEAMAESKLVTGKPITPHELALVILGKIRRIPGETILKLQIEHLQEMLVERLKNDRSNSSIKP